VNTGAWRKALGDMPRLVPEYEIDVPRTALVLIEMQNSALRPEFGGTAMVAQRHAEIAARFFPRVQQVVVPNIQRLLEAARTRGLRVIHVVAGTDLPDGRDWFTQGQPGGRDVATGAIVGPHRGSAAWQVISELAPLPGELVWQKPTSGGFGSGAFDTLLRTLGVRTLLCAGVLTNGSVESCARDAADRGYAVILVDDGCAAWDQAMHDATMRYFVMYLGNARSTDDLIRQLLK
jgi:biuret amidohydrolase